MNALRKKPLLRKTVATGFFVFGTVALALPLLPGWLLIGLGLYLLSLDSPRIQERFEHYRGRYRAVDWMLKRTYDKLHQARASQSDQV